MTAFLDTLYMGWIVGSKDIVDALKNKRARTNILVMIAMVLLFYYLDVLRPFDKEVSVVVYDEGHRGIALPAAKLADGSGYVFATATSLSDMEAKMAHRTLGLVLPADQNLSPIYAGTPTLRGYIAWAQRSKVGALEAKYSQALSELLQHPTHVAIGSNIVIPAAEAGGAPATLAQQMVYAIFVTALILLPYLMLEERQTRTMDALLASPATPGQLVLGKALAGLFYVLVIGGLALALNGALIVHWGWALAAFLGCALLAIGLALALGSFVPSMQQLTLWTLVVALLQVVPPLFVAEPAVKAGIRSVLACFPSAALANLFRFACSAGATAAQQWSNLSIALAGIAAVYGLVVWKVRRSDR